MSQCPVCAASVPDDFGLIECSQCGAQLFVHMDGRVEHSGAVTEDVRESSNAAAAPVIEEEVPEFLEPFREFEPEPDAEIMEATPDLASDSDAFSESVDVIHHKEAATYVEGSPVELSSSEEDPLAVLDVDDEMPPAQYEAPIAKPSTIDSPDLRDVAQFANSSDSGGREGSLRYTILVEGIDTADVRNAFREAITDKKLLWDTDQILRSIRKGQVKIENVSSAKTHVVVTRLKHLPLVVTWEQHAIHES